MSDAINLAGAYRAARRPRQSAGYVRPAALALAEARRNLAAYGLAWAEYESARAAMGKPLDLAPFEAAKAEAESTYAAASALEKATPWPDSGFQDAIRGRRAAAEALDLARRNLAEARNGTAQKARMARASAEHSRLWGLCYPPAAKGPGSSLGAPWTVRGYSSAVLQWCEAPPFRLAGTAEALARLDHNGWYLDPESWGETARGAVYQLTARNGRARFLPAVLDPFNDGPAMLALADIETAEDSSEESAEAARRDAARRADRLAELYAESEREWQEADRAGRDARAKAAEALAEGKAWAEAVRGLRGLFRARHGLGLVGLDPDSVRAQVRAAVAQVRACCDSWQDARAEARRAIDDSKPGRRDSLRAAWAEGYAEGAY